MEKMTKERRNEIAYLYVAEKVRQRGIPTLKPNEIKREIGNTAKSLGISFEEASEFARELVLILVEAAFLEPEPTTKSKSKIICSKNRLGPVFTEEKPTEVPSVPEEVEQKKPLLGPAFD